ncbi:MAG: type III-A CRISPR-associated RAMP protein Csm5 [Armatimonadetes bacterium]|nr:type III-A CRISPR-associated RAMP protein Csm5 [Armatimonadota bacterium]CUU34972.1 CRISPR-associated protein Csm5 [Armatimonadetes bacterium DC]
MATLTYRMEILSPLHIGSGQEYSAFDGVFLNGRWYLIDLEKVIEQSKEDPTNLANAMMQRDFSWAGWLQRRNINAEQVARHSTPCLQNPGNTRIRACIRDPFWRPYIPGSTLKGAIRTAILEELVAQANRHQRQQWARRITQRDDKGRTPDRRYVGRNVLERDLLIGRAPDKANESNYDLLRALHVGDSEPIDPDRVQIGLIWVHTLRNNQLVQKRVNGEEYKIFAEWLPSGVQAQVAIRLDEQLLTQYSTRLGFNDAQVKAIRDFAAVCNARAKAVMESEQSFYQDYGLPRIAQFYQGLSRQLQSVESKSGFMLNIGWGGGWEVKTVTNPLTEDLDEEYWDIRRTYSLGRRDSNAFPKTRRLAYEGNQPVAPLGWVALYPEEV